MIFKVKIHQNLGCIMSKLIKILVLRSKFWFVRSKLIKILVLRSTFWLLRSTFASTNQNFGLTGSKLIKILCLRPTFASSCEYVWKFRFKKVIICLNLGFKVNICHYQTTFWFNEVTLMKILGLRSTFWFLRSTFASSCENVWKFRFKKVIICQTLGKRVKICFYLTECRLFFLLRLFRSWSVLSPIATDTCHHDDKRR